MLDDDETLEDIADQTDVHGNEGRTRTRTGPKKIRTKGTSLLPNAMRTKWRQQLRAHRSHDAKGHRKGPSR